MGRPGPGMGVGAEPMTLEARIEGKAKGLDRSRSSGHFRYDSENNRTNKALIYMLMANKAEEKGVQLPIPPGLHGYHIEITVLVAPRKRYTKKQLSLIAEGRCSPTGKPDLDNVAKLWLDGMKGIIEDDRFVTELCVSRRWSDHDAVVASLSWEPMPMEG